MNKIAVVVLIGILLAGGGIGVRLFFSQTASTQQQKSDIVSIGDGFLKRTSGNLILVKFPDKYLDGVDNFIEGMKISLVKVYGDKLKDAEIEPKETSNGTPYFTATIRLNESTVRVYPVGLCYLDESKSEIVGVVLFPPVEQ